MGRELFKSMTYEDGKVYTRQCSNNVQPKYYYKEENSGLTRQYNKLGKIEFEKWFLTNGLMTGNIEVLSGSNKVLRRLNYLSNLLWKDKKFKELKDNEYKAFDNTLNAKTTEDKELSNKEYKKIEEDIKQYISSFYDTHNSKFRNSLQER